jgi:hypothetical protein
VFRYKSSLAALLLLSFIAAACTATATNAPDPAPAATETQLPSSTPTEILLSATSAATQSTPPTPQPFAAPLSLGPDDFPAGYNPLTGQPVLDPATLDLPALLISVSNFPVEARPQAGLSFANYVFEIYITEGATRFLSVFHGDFPQAEVPVTGGCEVRMEPFAAGDTYLGNQVWLDTNSNGIQNYGEPGVGGVCVNLYNADGGLLEKTTTDSNGYYGFNVEPGAYTVEVQLPAGMQFTQPNAGDEDHDSDVDPASGRIPLEVAASTLTVDAGLVPPVGVTPTPNPTAKQADPEIGPVRSGRMVYAHFASMFQDSCLIYAFAAEEVLEKIPQCAMVAHEVEGGGAMLDVTRMRAIAEENEKADTVFNYASNRYTDLPPEGGVPAAQLDVFIALLNQSGWRYDPLMQSYLRYTDNADKATAGQLHPDTDRLNGRQLHFENVIVLFAEHEVIAPTIVDMDLAQGGEGPAMLFRDGQKYDIRWSTRSGAYEQRSGLRRPIQWVDRAGNPVPLKPGHSWVIVVTPFTTVTEQAAGTWKVRFYAPAGAQ